MSGSGFVLWFPHWFPVELVRWMYPLHDAFMILMVSLVAGHIYLATIAYQGSLGAMTHGYVTRGWAEYFHPAWFRSLTCETYGQKTGPQCDR